MPIFYIIDATINITIICLILLIIVCMSLKIFNWITRIKYITHYRDYLISFEDFLDKAYTLIYKDRILIYSIEATKITDEQFRVDAKDFASLTKKLMGPKHYNHFIDFYGDEATLLFNIVEYFNTKYEEDEIRKNSVENLMDN